MIITRYLFREIAYILFALTFLLLMIYISHRFMSYLLQASNGALPAEFILRLLLLKLLSDLMLILPLGFFLAILLTLGRLYSDNEMTVLAACGMPLPFKSILFFGSLFAVFIGILSLFLAPWAEDQMSTLKTQANVAAEVGGIAAGRFKEFRKGAGAFYTESIDEKTNIMQVVFSQIDLPDKKVLFTAKRGYREVQQGVLYLVLEEGYRYERKADSLEYTITEFAKHSIKIPKRVDTPDSAQNYEAIPTGLLLQDKTPQAIAELQWRFSLPLSVILLAALAIPLSHTTPRQGQYAKIFTGILIYLVYNNLLNVAQKWVERGDVPSVIGVWWVHMLLLGIIFMLYHLPTLKYTWQRKKILRLQEATK